MAQMIAFSIFCFFLFLKIRQQSLYNNKEQSQTNNNMSLHSKNKQIYSMSPTKNQLSSTLQVKRPQAYQQFLSHQYNPHQNDHQKTTRITPTQFQLKSSQNSAKNKPQQSQNGNDVQSHLAQLTNQISSQRDTITRISHIIDYLTDKNQELNYRYVQAVQELERVENFYSEKLEIANNLIKELEEKCSRSQTSGMQSRSTHGKITPIKICSKNPDDNYYVSFSEIQRSVIKDLGRMILSQKISNIENQLDKLQQFSNNESLQIQTTIEQHKYLQAFIEDEILGITDNQTLTKQQTQIKNNINNKLSSEAVLELLGKYQSQIVGWQNYGNMMKKLLMECIGFIEKFIGAKDVKVQVQRRSYTNADLVKYITQEICNNFRKNQKKSKQQIQQMCQLLKDAFKQLKKYQQKQKDSLQIHQS